MQAQLFLNELYQGEFNEMVNVMCHLRKYLRITQKQASIKSNYVRLQPIAQVFGSGRTVTKWMMIRGKFYLVNLQVTAYYYIPRKLFQMMSR